MLQVKTYIDKSHIHGIGLFAAENIKVGNVVWSYIPWFDKSFSISHYRDILKMKNPLGEYVRKYSFYDRQTDMIILSGDDDRFTNHSNNPNTKPNEFGDMIAARDIKKGEEITANYYEIDKYADDKLHLSLFEDE